MTDILDVAPRTLPAPMRLQTKPAVPPPAPVHRPTHRVAVAALLPLRIFLAAGWLRAGAEKMMDPQWWTGAKLRSFLTAQDHDALPFFRPVMDGFIAPHAQVVAVVVVVTQLLCGLAIAVGRPLRSALRWGVLLNVVFILAGRVNPSAFYLVMEIVLLFAVADHTLGTRPTVPSRRTVVLAAVSAAGALAMVPYIRTIAPADVIEDPAMMLTFLGLTISVTLLVRRAAYRPRRLTYTRQLWATWAASWMLAKPEKHVRRDLEPPYSMP